MTVEIAKGGNRNTDRKLKTEGPTNKLFVLGYNPLTVKEVEIRYTDSLLSLTHSLIHSITHSLTHSLTEIYLLTLAK